MKQFSKLYSDFWINYDNVEVMGLGIDAQLMALYLQGNHHRNILGVYYLPLLYIASDLRLSVKRAKTILEKLCKINYCRYDYKTQYIWVCDLAFEQIGINIGAKDNRIKALQTVWESLPLHLEFLKDIYNKYHTAFYLKPRVFENSSKDNYHLMVTDDKDNDETRKGSSPKKPKIFPFVVNDKNQNTYSLSSLEASLPVPSTFEGSSKTLESSLNVESSDISHQKSFFEPSLENRGEISSEVSSDTTDEGVSGTTSCVVLTQDPLSSPDKSKAEGCDDALAISCVDAFAASKDIDEDITNPFEDSSKVPLLPSEASSAPLQRPFEGGSKTLQSPLEGPSELLRSNIEYRSKIIEDRSNNIENRSKIIENRNNKKNKKERKEIEKKEKKEEKETEEIKNNEEAPLLDITTQQTKLLEGKMVYKNSFFPFSHISPLSSVFENCKNIKKAEESKKE